MSAFVVDTKKINNILNLFTSSCNKSSLNWIAESEGLILSAGDYDHSATKLGQLLHDENIKSVNYRYCDNEKPLVFSFIKQIEKVSIIQALKTLSCIEYQSCEHDEWESSKAYRVVQKLRKTLVSNLEGYDSAEWG